MASPAFTLRPASLPDAPTILSLIHSLAAFEREPPSSVLATEALVERNCFGEGVARVVLAEVEGKEGREAVGMALYFFNFSTWTGRPGLYLEDLFVKEEYRKLGIGKALFKELGRIAKEKDCGRMEWVVLDWNTPAKDFYTKKLGAKHMAAWEIMRLEGEGIDRLAELS